MSAGSLKCCPQCGSAGVDFSELAGGTATCRGCRWVGVVDDLLAVSFEHDFITDEAMFLNLLNAMRRLVSGQLGLPYLDFLIKWGFLKADPARIKETVDRKKFARYIAAIARGVLTSILQERAKIEAEVARERMS